MNYKEKRKKVEEKKKGREKGQWGEAVEEIQRLGKRADYMLE